MSERFSLRSMTFNMISTLLRGNLSQENSQSCHGSHKPGSFIYFKDKEIQISEKEKQLLKHFESNQLLLGMLTGQIDSWLKDMNTNTTINHAPKHGGSMKYDQQREFQDSHLDENA
mmetsp:Transcript_22587/g.22426  ORF Transcript_22587/g.22426 Transcript_22587/m.22426 type:complete len:116 (+) Transcript_22587:284-631(+)